MVLKVLSLAAFAFVVLTATWLYALYQNAHNVPFDMDDLGNYALFLGASLTAGVVIFSMADKS